MASSGNQVLHGGTDRIVLNRPNDKQTAKFGGLFVVLESFHHVENTTVGRELFFYGFFH